jgi:hypothetical protein
MNSTCTYGGEFRKWQRGHTEAENSKSNEEMDHLQAPIDQGRRICHDTAARGTWLHGQLPLVGGGVLNGNAVHRIQMSEPHWYSSKASEF